MKQRIGGHLFEAQPSPFRFDAGVQLATITVYRIDGEEVTEVEFEHRFAEEWQGRRQAENGAH